MEGKKTKTQKDFIAFMKGSGLKLQYKKFHLNALFKKAFSLWSWTLKQAAQESFGIPS